MMLDIVPSFKKISQRVSELLSAAVCILKFSKGHNSVNSVGGLIVLA